MGFRGCAILKTDAFGSYCGFHRCKETELLELPLLINRYAQDSSSRTLIAAVVVQSKVSVLYCQPWIRKQIIDLLWVPP